MERWKSKKDSLGNVNLNGISYSFTTAKPNTYHPDKHKSILESQSFFDFAHGIISTTKFNKQDIHELTGGQFELWKQDSIVIPSFLLHTLSPIIYPLYDQHVERAKRALSAQTLNYNGYLLKKEDYFSYKEFFDDFLKIVYDPQYNLGIEDVKGSR